MRDPVTNLRYPMAKASSQLFVESVEHFIEDFLSGSLRPTINSEPLPPQKSEEPLIKIVGLNYQDIVMDSSRDVLVVFCIAPCGPCEGFQPTLELLAALYASNLHLKHRVAIGKIMYDINDTPERKTRGFPTIKLFPAASKTSPKTFLGPRTLDSLAEFIRDGGTFHAGLQSLEEQKIGNLERMSKHHNVMCDAPGRACAAGPDREVQFVSHSEL